MSSSSPSKSKFVQKILELAAVDRSLLVILSERKKADAELADAKKKFAALVAAATAKKASIERLQSSYTDKEKALQAQEESLAARRDKVSTFGSFKNQQAALGEIANSERELRKQEDLLLEELGRIEDERRSLNLDIEKVRAAKAEQEKLDQDFLESKAIFDKREEEQLSKRFTLTSALNPAHVKLYEKTKGKFPMDPIVAVIEGRLCGACGATLPPRVLVSLEMDAELTLCTECARILYRKDEE